MDYNTLGLLTGRMVIVAIARRSGMFQYLAIWPAKRVNTDSCGILVMLAVVTAVFSAFRDNVTTVLLVTAVSVTGDNLAVTAQAMLWLSALASSIVDNNPFVAILIPVIKSMAPAYGGSASIEPVWWSPGSQIAPAVRSGS